MATDLGKGPAQAAERTVRPRGGAHAAGPRSATRPRSAAGPRSAPDRRRAADPRRGPDPAEASGPSAAAALCAAAVIAIAVPLAVLQIPDAIAWSLPDRIAASGPGVTGSLLRAAGLALPAMAVAAPFGALAVRRFRPGPVLVAGLLSVAVADALGGLARTVLLVGVDRTLHGLGAGISLAAAAGIVAERRRVSRSLVGWWASAMVFALAVTPALMRHRVTAGGWHAALQPYPWLVGVALALAALYAVTAEGAAPVAVRIAFPPAERSLLALLAAPVTGLCAIAVAVTNQGDRGVAAAAITAAAAVVGLSVAAGRASTAGRLAAVCAVTGFTVAPAAETITALAPASGLSPKTGLVAAAAAVSGAALALARRRPGRPEEDLPPGGRARSAGRGPGGDDGRVATVAGLFAAAAAYGAAYLAGPAATRAGVLALLCVPLAGGLSAALAAAWRNAGTGGAVCGVVLLLTGVVGGYLAVTAVQLQAAAGAQGTQGAQGAPTAAAVHAALLSTQSDWALIAAGVTGALALGLARGPARRRSGGPRATAERG